MSSTNLKPLFLFVGGESITSWKPGSKVLEAKYHWYVISLSSTCFGSSACRPFNISSNGVKDEKLKRSKQIICCKYIIMSRIHADFLLCICFDVGFVAPAWKTSFHYRSFKCWAKMPRRSSRTKDTMITPNLYLLKTEHWNFTSTSFALHTINWLFTIVPYLTTFLNNCLNRMNIKFMINSSNRSNYRIIVYSFHGYTHTPKDIFSIIYDVTASYT